MRTTIVIPSRFGSTRFPGKPLADIAGKSLIQRVYEIGQAVEGVDDVIVATDDDRIFEHVEGFSGKAVMTGECVNGTERVWQAVEKMDTKPDVIINLQGDAVLTPPWTIQAVVDEMKADRSVLLCTPAVRMTDELYKKITDAKAQGEVGGTTVVFNKKHDAMYFSKNIIPYVRERVGEKLPVFRHIGLYGYTYACLERYLKLDPTELELTEGLEQLRALENGIPIRVVEVSYDDPATGKARTHWAVDSPEDAKRAEQIIAEEGELV